MKVLWLQSISMDNNLLRFTLSHCVDQVEDLVLRSCGITNKIVEQLAERIKKRSKPVKYCTDFFNSCKIFHHCLCFSFMPPPILKNGWSVFARKFCIKKPTPRPCICPSLPIQGSKLTIARFLEASQNSHGQVVFWLHLPDVQVNKM